MKNRRRHSKRLIPAFAAGLLLLTLSGFPGAAQDEAQQETETATGFEAYRLIATRNIFDPTRRAGRPPRETNPRPSEPDRLEFVGTLIDPGDPDNAQAFFKSTESRLQRAFTVNESVIDHTLVEIGPTKLRLQPEGEEPFEIEKGQQFIREEGEDWAITSNPQPFGDRVNNSSTRRTRQSVRETLTPRNSRNNNNDSGDNNGGFGRGNRNNRFGGDGGFGGRGGAGNFFGQDDDEDFTPVVTPEPLETSGASPAEILRMMQERREREMEQ